jgi:hypothetical protein
MKPKNPNSSFSRWNQHITPYILKKYGNYKNVKEIDIFERAKCSARNRSKTRPVTLPKINFGIDKN